MLTFAEPSAASSSRGAGPQDPRAFTPGAAPHRPWIGFLDARSVRSASETTGVEAARTIAASTRSFSLAAAAAAGDGTRVGNRASAASGIGRAAVRSSSGTSRTT